MNKVELRREFLARRKALTSEEVTRSSQLMADHFFAYVEQNNLGDTLQRFIPFCLSSGTMKLTRGQLSSASG